MDTSARSDSLRDQLRHRGLRWTSRRQSVVDVLASSDGHVTGAELVERCRARDATTTPSTVYRTLDLLEELGLVRHGHGADGREEYHVLPTGRHGHLHCSTCGATWEIDEDRGELVADVLRAWDGFELDISHVTLVGRCRECAGRA
jgi:Fur family transcriptional regulator, ferric uptake regulator